MVYQPSIEYALCFLSIIGISFWIVIWIMHACALANARFKFNTQRNNNIKKKNQQQQQQQQLQNKQQHQHFKHQKQFQASNNDINNNNINNSQLDNNHHSNNLMITTSNQHHANGMSKLCSHIAMPMPGVSIIKPLVGVDLNLAQNLQTFFTLDYPLYELLFCVQDADDLAAIALVEELLKTHPHIDARLFVGGAQVGVNPKINNMQPAYEAMKYELLLISDSGIFMNRDTLTDMVHHMHEDTALVHQMPFVSDNRNGFLSVLEKVYFGTSHARAYLTADLLSINCATGMSALMRKSLLDEVGGIKAFGQYLAEDYFFAKSFTDRGWRLTISSQPALQNSANSSDNLGILHGRMQRWIKLRFAMVPQWTLLEPFSECMLLGVISALSVNYMWALNAYAIFLAHVLFWIISDYNLLYTIRGGPPTMGVCEFLSAWLLRECTALLVFLEALFDPKVRWRSRVFRLKWGGYAEEIFPPEIAMYKDNREEDHVQCREVHENNCSRCYNST